MFTKNETTKYIEHATASSLNGPYTFNGTGNWSGWGSGEEGISVTHLDSGAWRIYMDNYSGGHYYYSDSSNLNTWSTKADVPGGLSGVIRHGTVLHDTFVTQLNRQLRGNASGRCLTAPTANGTQVTIQDCTGSSAQLWSYTTAGTLTIGGTRCLDVYGQGTANGTVVDVWTCNGGNNQRWQQNADGSFTGVQSGRCLDVTSAGTANGTSVKLYTCNGAPNQAWAWCSRKRSGGGQWGGRTGHPPLRAQQPVSTA